MNKRQRKKNLKDVYVIRAGPECGITLVQRGSPSHLLDIKLYPSGKTVLTFRANSWIKACRRHHRYWGWEPYKPWY